MATLQSTATPDAILAQVTPVIRKHAASGEIQRRLAPEAVQAMIDAGVFRAWIPQALGGLELDPLSVLRVFEGIAHADGSAGWVASNSTNATLLGQILPDDGAAEVFSDPKLLLAGAAFPPGAAVPVDGGYRITGQWNFGSACNYATWLGGAALVMDGDVPRLGPDGNPVMVLALFPAADVEIVDNWNTLGLRGTGSHDYRVQDVFAPERRVAVFAPFDHPGAAYKGPLYRMGFWLDAIRIAITALGIARAAVEDAIALAATKTPSYTMTGLADRPVAQDRIARAKAAIEAGMSYVERSVQRAYEHTLASGARIGIEQGIPLALAGSYGHEAANQAVDLVHWVVGTSGIRAEQRFQQYFRDVHTVSQHAFSTPSRFELVGKLLLGRETDWAFYTL